VPAEELKFMQEVSRRIRDHGPGLLDTLKERERENPKFDFLFENEVRMFHGSN
jgi:U2-associated protein SR140